MCEKKNPQNDFFFKNGSAAVVVWAEATPSQIPIVLKSPEIYSIVLEINETHETSCSLLCKPKKKKSCLCVK